MSSRTRLIRSLTVRAALVYLALRAVTAVLLVLAARDQVPVAGWTGKHPGYLDMTVMWDGSWYRQAAEQGYPSVLPVDEHGFVAQNVWAFYPLFPMLSRLLMGATGLGFAAVASTLALLCGLGAAVVMVHLLADRVGARVALAAVAVWAAFPASPALQLSYTESLAMLLLCGFLIAVMRRSWLPAGLLALMLGLTRPIAVPLIVVMVVALCCRWRSLRTDRLAVGRPELVRGGLGLLACGVSAVIWPAVAWYETGVRSAYTDTMAAWRASHQIAPFEPWWGMSVYVFRGFAGGRTYGPVVLAAIAMGIVVLVLGPWARALGAELRTWSLAYPAYLLAVLDPFTSIYRYLLPLFPLLVVMVGGGWLGRSGRFTGWRATVLVAMGLLGQVAWIWKLLVFVPPSDYPP